MMQLLRFGLLISIGLGSTSNSQELEIYATTHHVWLGAHHAKIVVISDQPVYCVGCPEWAIINDQTQGCHVAGTESGYCITLGSGPEPSGLDAKLFGTLNRHTDVTNENTSDGVKVPIPGGIDAKAILESLINSLGDHQKEWDCFENAVERRIDYDLFPDIQDGHNSNSFVSGIFTKVGTTSATVRPDKFIPGYDREVPPERFTFNIPNCP